MNSPLLNAKASVPEAESLRFSLAALTAAIDFYEGIEAQTGTDLTVRELLRGPLRSSWPIRENECTGPVNLETRVVDRLRDDLAYSKEQVKNG